MSERPRLAITGGGTGGHVSPAVAVIEELRQRSPAPEFLYLGSRSGTEARIIPVMGLRYVSVSTGKLRRYLSFENLIDTMRVPLGIVQALAHLARFRPHAVLATGGYVSVPTVFAAWMLRRPVLIHEQTGTLGLANRINARFASQIALSVPGSEARLRTANWVLTGNPVRSAVRGGDRETAARRFRFNPGEPTVYITGGAQGAHAINQAVLGALEPLLRIAQVIHQCGDSEGTRADHEALVRRTRELDDDLQARYTLLRYVGQEIGEAYALADLVIGRAGAGTVNELAALSKPSILVPLPHSAGDEQRQNARRMQEAGAAEVIEESSCSSERIVSLVRELLTDPSRLEAMSRSAESLGLAHAELRIADLLLELARTKGRADV